MYVGRNQLLCTNAVDLVVIVATSASSLIFLL